MTCTCSPSILDPLCPVAEHRVMAKAALVGSAYFSAANDAYAPVFAPAVRVALGFKDPAGNETPDGQPFAPNPNHPIEQMQRNGGKLTMPTIAFTEEAPPPADPELDAEILRAIVGDGEPEDGCE